MARKDDLIVGLDIGTTKVCAVVGEIKETGLDIVGIGTYLSKGLRKGVVVNIDHTVESIKYAVEEAELMAGCEISSVYAGIAGGHIKGFNSHGIVAIREKEVKETDLMRVIDAAQAVAIPMDREVLHCVPQEYIIDGQDGIMEPLGMSGVRFEAKVHIITGAVTSAQNIVKCANRCGLVVNDIVLEPLASSQAVLSPEEKELGVALVDIGGGTTDICVFSKGSIVHSAVISIGGNHLTGDIAVGLRTPTNEAEKIKQKWGCALTAMIDREDTIEVQSVGGRKPRVLSRQILAEIIEPRMEEILNMVHQEIIRAGYWDLLSSGMVVTGGSAIMHGIPELAEQMFDMPVRRGIPRGVGGLIDVISSPMFSTGVGLVQYGQNNTFDKKFRIREKNVYGKVRNRMREWLEEIF